MLDATWAKSSPSGSSPMNARATRKHSHASVAKLALPSALNHPNLCGNYEIGNENEPSFIAMEDVEGEKLKHRMGSTSAGWIQGCRVLSWRSRRTAF